MSHSKQKNSLRPVSEAFSRRFFLKATTLGSIGFVIGCSERPASDAAVVTAEVAPIDTTSLGAFVRISSDNTVTVIIKHLDKGQGVTTGLPAIVAEELDADWSQIRTEFAPADPSRYNHLFFGEGRQATGGSTSVANSWMQLRQAAAAARDMLVRTAASNWDVAAQDIFVSGGVLSHGDRRATFGELAEAAGTLSPPADVKLKDPADFSLIGTTLPRTDSAAKTDGTAKFTVDLVRPDVLIAVVARPPRFGSKVASYDDSEASKIAGVKRVVEIPRGVVVLADSFYSATKGRDALSIEWNDDDAETRSSAEIDAEYSAMLDEPGTTLRDDGNFVAAFDGAASTVEADYTFPYLAHAAMEPLDCLIELSADRCEVWTASQMQSDDQIRVAEITGLELENVFINTVMAGGSFGRRAASDGDFVVEAATIAKAIDGEFPVKLQWTREDDMRGGRYRPMAKHRMRAAIGSDGKLLAWDQRVVCQSIMKGTAFEALMQNGIDPTATEGSLQLPYAIDNFHLDLHVPESRIPVLWWRSVGHSHNAYATEVFLDQIAVAMDRDPYELRREMLAGQDRYLGVLDVAAKESGWGTPLGAGRGRGIALHKSFNTYVAEVAEVSVSETGELSIDRVVCAVDCGIAITPDVIRAQMEGGIGYGLSAALREAVTLTDGIVDQQNFHQYKPLRINEMPTIEVHIIPSTEAPSGVGEPGLPPAAAAVANAIANASGTFLRELPFANQLKTS